MKKIFIIFTVLILCSCTRKISMDYKIKTIIEENTNTVVAINYPITSIKKLNKEIKKFVNSNYNNFLKNYDKISYLNKKHELNIDYIYNNVGDKYISVTLIKHISSSNNDFNLNEVFTYVYDIEKNKKITFNELIKTDNNIKDLVNNSLLNKYGNIINMEKLLKIDYKNINFHINNNNVLILFEGDTLCDNYDEVLEVNIPISNFEKLKNIKINEENLIANTNQTVNYIDTSKPVVALTFDDGPSIYTEEILNTLKKYNSNATFFVLGNKIDNYSNIIIKMYENGNEIGNHSYNHRWLTKLSTDEQKEQINKTQEIIKKYTGYTPIYMRPTYGSINKKLRENINLEVVLWSVDTRDWKYKNIDTIVNNALTNVKDGSIILMHDTHERTSEAVKKLVPKLIEKGYQLVTISELKEVKEIRNKLNEKQ